jgi:general secretion pathway protein G
MRKVKNHRAHGGFTLIELLLVMAILAVLAAVVVPKFVARGDQAKITAAQTDISNMKTALDACEVDTGQYPATLDGLVNNPGLNGWHGPYLEQVRKDPWGNEYIYRPQGTVNTSGYDLLSAGKNATEGDDDDITNVPVQR